MDYNIVPNELAGDKNDVVVKQRTQFQAPPLPPPTINETEITLARIQQLQQQYTALASQLGTQKPDQKSPEAQGASRLNQYPLV